MKGRIAACVLAAALLLAGCSSGKQSGGAYTPKSDDELATLAKSLGRDPKTFDGLSVASMDGTYVIGRDLKPGDYRTTSPAKGVDPTSCKWELRSPDGTLVTDSTDLGGSMPDRVTQGLRTGQTFITENCGLWEQF